MQKFFFASILFLIGFSGFSQSDSLKTLDLYLEFRPRFEYRDGYKSLPSETLQPAFFINTRTRLNLTFKKKSSTFHISGQDVRVWGQNGASPATNTLSVFEAYSLFKIKDNWELKIGRQAIELDNGRLFSRANWSQVSRAHDGIRLNYNRPEYNSSLFLFYNQNSVNNFGTNYTPNFYKYLLNHSINLRLTRQWNLHVMNAFDGYQSIHNENTIYARGTSGGRLTYKTKKFQGTIAGYYQYGQLKTGQKISAFYFQPEISYRIKKLKTRLGMEYLSGDDLINPSAVSHSFSTLYGVAFKFMGHLNYFTSFPNDVKSVGLINPYLFFTYRLSNRTRIKIESHTFFAQNNLNADPFLGIEIDLKFKYILNNEMVFDFGFSAMKATSSMALLKTGDFTKIPVFSFLMFTWKPNLIHSEKQLFR